jgi:recombination protein RecR
MSAPQIEHLIQLLSRLPGFGPRSARRSALFLMDKKDSHLLPLIQAMQEVADHVKVCPICGNMDTETPCSICTNSKRDGTQICVVEDVADLWAIERAGLFKGHYHVLGGVLSSASNIASSAVSATSNIASGALR